MKKQNIFLFIFILFLSFGNNIANLCRSYLPLTFDNQILLTWEYSVRLGQFPYKDLFYPYGLFNFYKTHEIIFSIIYLLLAPLLLVCLFMVLQKLFKDKLFSYFSFFILYMFILKITGFDVFTRYGILIVFASFFAQLFYAYKGFLSKKKLFLIGVSLGVVLPFFNDQGIYSFVLFIAFLLIDRLICRKLTGVKNMYALFFDIVISFSGFFIGLFPFIIYLFFNNALPQFIASFSELSHLQQLAKTPFFHSITVDNAFTLTSLLLTLFFLGYKLFYVKSQISFNTYLQIGFVLALIIVEQKNVMRHIDNQLTFMGLLLFILLFYELRKMLLKYKVSNLKIFLYYVNIVVVIFFLIGLRSTDLAKNPSGMCLKSDTRFAISSKGHELVKKEFEKIPQFNGKIFSYPGDTIFYIIFKQNPPYYPSSFEASSLKAQEKLISQIKDQKIEYIIYNYKNIAIQDEVPNLVRTVTLHRYILNNYSVVNRVGDFLILQKNKKNEDFFGRNNLDQISDFKNTLLHVDLANVPRTEGIYKNKDFFMKKTKVIISSNSIVDLNNFIKQNKLNSDHTFLVIQFKDKIKSGKKSSVKIKTKDGLETGIKFNTCQVGNPCVINLSNIPIFYKSRVIDTIVTDNDNGIATITLLYIPENANFW